ncbi:S8 family serine peptidase [Lentzea sp. E54]|uniref:S8 family serine peptidase n=1 Tax=Lentzea xerophila TaxID=3435883 RepID=UPI003DA3AF0E
MAGVAVVIALLTTPAWVAAPAAAAQNCAAAEEKVVESESWAQRRMAASRAWSLAEGAVRVAVVGTGVSAQAPALAGAVLRGTDLANGAGDSDCSGHGTFLAGLLAARPVEGSAFTGVAPAAEVLPVKVTDNPANVDPARLARGVRAAVDGGARVIAVGVVTAVDDQALRAAVADAVARDVVVVAPAAVPKEGERAYPAALPGVLAVAPVGPGGGDAKGSLGADPTLAAPAEQLVGIAPSGAGHRTGSAPELAVAFVAGAAALVRDYHDALPASGVAERLLATADRPAGPVPNPLVGHGIVDPVAAVTTVLAAGESEKSPAAVERLVVPMPAQVDPGPARRAMWFVGILVAGVALLGGRAALIALGRHQRTGENPTPAAGESP